MTRGLMILVAMVAVGACSDDPASGSPDARGPDGEVTCADLQELPLAEDVEECQFHNGTSSGGCSPVRVKDGVLVCIDRDLQTADDAGMPLCVLVTCDL
jgi:hypothetical protein